MVVLTSPQIFRPSSLAHNSEFMKHSFFVVVGLARSVDSLMTLVHSVTEKRRILKFVNKINVLFKCTILSVQNTQDC